MPPDRSQIPVLLYHGVSAGSEFSNEADAGYGIDPEDFAKQMTLLDTAGYETVTLDQFVRFTDGEAVQLPPRPLLLTFDDARADSWTGADGILRELKFDAVMFVDVGAVDRDDPEYLTWTELGIMQEGGRWDLQLHSGRGHQQIQYGPGPDDVGPFYAYRQSDESLSDWRERVRSDLEWGDEQLDAHVPGFRPRAFAPPYGNYGQEGTNDPHIPDELLTALRERFAVIFTQDRSPFATPGPAEPHGRLQVTRDLTGGELHAQLTSGGGR